jgi:hypothetical protein
MMSFGLNPDEKRNLLDASGEPCYGLAPQTDVPPFLSDITTVGPPLNPLLAAAFPRVCQAPHIGFH